MTSSCCRHTAPRGRSARSSGDSIQPTTPALRALDPQHAQRAVDVGKGDGAVAGLDLAAYYPFEKVVESLKTMGDLPAFRPRRGEDLSAQREARLRFVARPYELHRPVQECQKRVRSRHRP